MGEKERKMLAMEGRDVHGGCLDVEVEKTPVEECEPHAYVPSALHMGDCMVCGHLQDAAHHSPFRR